MAAHIPRRDDFKHWEYAQKPVRKIIYKMEDPLEVPTVIRNGETQLLLDFSDLDRLDIKKIINDYLPKEMQSISVYELHRILNEGILFEIRQEQATHDDNFCQTVIGDLPCGNVAEFFMEDGTKICFECYKIYQQRFGSKTGKVFTEIG